MSLAIKCTSCANSNASGCTLNLEKEIKDNWDRIAERNAQIALECLEYIYEPGCLDEEPAKTEWDDE